MSNSNLIREIQKEFLQENREEIKTGMEVEVYQILKEGSKERIQRFKWLVIKTAGKSALENTMTVRRKSIKFIRNLTGKAARLKEVKKG